MFQVPRCSGQMRLRPRPQAKAGGLRRTRPMHLFRHLELRGAGLDWTTAQGIPVKSDKGIVSVITIRRRNVIPSPMPLSF